MPDYRAYLIDHNDRVVSFRSFTAATDAEALGAAREYLDGMDVEVWERARKIGRLNSGSFPAKR